MTKRCLMTACCMLLARGAWSQVEYEPAELENPENELQREKRMALRAMRISAMGNGK